MKIETAGRKDLGDFWSGSGILDYEKYPHNPVLAFEEVDGGVAVRILTLPEDVGLLPPATKCMAQWPGKWRSDFFQFTVQEFVDAQGAKRARREKHGAVS